MTSNTVSRSYLSMWRRVPGAWAASVVSLPLAIIVLTVLAIMFTMGAGLAILLVGVAILSATLITAHFFGRGHLAVVDWAGLEPITPAPVRRGNPQAATLTRLAAPLRSAHGWSALVHGMIVAPILTGVTFSFAIAWTSTALAGITSPIWHRYIPASDPWGGYVRDAVGGPFTGMNESTVEVVCSIIAGIIFLVTLPWILHMCARALHGTARLMLGRWASDDLAEIAEAERRARNAAVHAEDAGLRRLERDLHDGPQQRLLRLQMDLDTIARRSATGENVDDLAREARVQAGETLRELRALSSGVVPPLLQDRGLSAAVESLGALSPTPVTIKVADGVDEALSSESARSLYFVTAELLANTTKHAQATEIAVDLRVLQGDLPEIALTVADNGIGGAQEVQGHGLAGLAERIAGLRGTMALASNPGEGTSVVVRVPADAR